MTEEQQNAVLESIKTTMGNARTVQKQRIGENVQVVVQALKKIEADIKARYDETGKAIEKRVASIKDGRDGRDGVDGRAGKDGRPGRDGAVGPRGIDGLNGSNGIDGQDGISITDAHIDFDGSLIITLSDGKLLNVGEVVSQDIAEKIKVIQTMSTNGAVGISDEGSSISTGVKNINFVGATVTATNSGDDVTVNVSAGTGTVTSVAVSGGSTGLTTSGGPITTTGTITLGGTLAVASGGTGTATPGLVAGTNITSITGSWPNQTINASGGSGTVTSVAATGGTGISVSGSPITTSGTLTITNTAPDQTVALTQGGTTTITGTYPNFTISSADQFVGTVTSVTGTSPVVSSGGTTPAISLASGYGDTLNPYASKTANFVLAAPDGTAGVPTFRAVVAADIPTLNQNTTGTASNVTGTVAIINGGTGEITRQAAMDALAGSTTSGQYLRGNGADVVMSAIQVADVPTLNQSTTGNAATATLATNVLNSSGIKNRIINGAMVIDQRNAGASVTFDGSATKFPVDRFGGFEDTDGEMTGQQDSSAPSGFKSSVKLTTTTADASLGATQRVIFRQLIEGQNVYDLAWGTASAATVTISFWVRSSLTGTHGGAVTNGAQDRSYPFNYSISVADTWEQKSITIAGDTSGTWLTTNGIGIRLIFGMGVGSTYSGTAGAWAGTRYESATGAVSVIGTLNATWYVTGVQLEKGSTATSFDYRPITTEFQLCSRYFQIYGGQGGSPNFQSYGSGDMNTVYPLPVEMRVTPTGTTSGTWAKSNCGDPTMVHAGTTAITVRVAVTILGKFEVYPSGGSGKITLSSEL
jgi:hypothetical protein